MGMELPDQLLINNTEHAGLLNYLSTEAKQILLDEETALEINAPDDETVLRSDSVTKKRRVECPNCKKSVTNLAEHMRIHTGEKPYHCNQCNYSSIYSGDLTKHMHTHTGEKPFKCDQCDYSCAQKGNLILHMRTHTSEKPYKCDQCDYSCTQSGTLIRHMRTHTSEKLYKCDQCDYSSAQKNNLTKHIRTHTGAADSNLTRHMRIDHAGKKSKQNEKLIWHEENPAKIMEQNNEL